MDRYVAFLRAINVGDRRVKMAELRDHVAELGFADVATHIASGNVIVSSEISDDEVESVFETDLAKRLGFDVPTFVRSGTELEVLVANPPDIEVGAEDVLSVGFLKEIPAAGVIDPLIEAAPDNQVVAVAGRQVWWRRVKGDARGLAFDIEGKLGRQTTFRNVTTLQTMIDKHFGGNR